MLDPVQLVADLVLEHSECAPVFQRHRIDYCRGDVSLAAAALARGLDLGELLGELDRAVMDRQLLRPTDPRTLGTPELVLYITTKHHAYLRNMLPFISNLAAKVSRVHGDRDPQLRDVAQCVQVLTEMLLPHLDDEEHVLFPELTKPRVEARNVATLLHTMMDEHRAVGALLGHLRDAARGFQAPEWACTNYRMLMTELHQLESDTLTHVHLENHVLLPRFVLARGVALKGALVRIGR